MPLGSARFLIALFDSGKPVQALTGSSPGLDTLLFVSSVNYVTHLDPCYELFSVRVGFSRKCRLTWMWKFDPAPRQKISAMPLLRSDTTSVVLCPMPITRSD